jgi:hypothetical protein
VPKRNRHIVQKQSQTGNTTLIMDNDFAQQSVLDNFISPELLGSAMSQALTRYDKHFMDEIWTRTQKPPALMLSLLFKRANIIGVQH